MAGHIRFFSNEKFVIVDAHEFVVARTKFPVSVHVLDVFGEGDIMPPHFFNKGETITKEVYARVVPIEGCTSPHESFGPKLANTILLCSGPRNSSHITAHILIPWTTLYGA